MKVKKKFYYEDIELRIVERDEPYMNGKESLKIIRVLAPNGGIVPVHIQRRQTLKSIVEETVNTLNVFAERGADVKNELTKEL